MNYIKVIPVLFIFGVPILSRAQIDLSVAGDPDTAPIYVLDGTGTTSFKINETIMGSIVVDGDFTFSMSSVATGNVTTSGTYEITGDDGGGVWDADFDINTTYLIKKYGDFVVVNFNHSLNSTPGPQTIMGNSYSSATCSSKGNMILTGDWELLGLMSGTVIGYQGASATLRHPYKNVPFEQVFSDVESVVGGEWVADIDWVVAGRRLTGSGQLIVGADTNVLTDFDISDPVDIVDLSVNGRSTGLLLTFTAAGTGLEKRVALRISYADDPLVPSEEVPADDADLAGSISAAAQSRSF